MTKEPTETVVIIGAGNLANSLAPALKGAGLKILQVYSRTEESGEFLANKLDCEYTTHLDDIRKDADIYFLLLTDQATLSFISKFDFPEALIVHASGGLDISVLEGCSMHYGVFYPVQTFTKKNEIEFKNIPICIEASDTVSQEKLFGIAKKLSDVYYLINSIQRKYLHVAAVFACNYVNHMYDISADILEDANLPFDLLHPLIKETANKAVNNSPHDIQTGPSIRNDKVVINEHLKLLAANPHFQGIYEELSSSIQKIFKDN